MVYIIYNLLYMYINKQYIKHNKLIYLLFYKLYI